METSCTTCQRHQRSKIKEPLKSKETPQIPFIKIVKEIIEDNGGNCWYLVVMDVYFICLGLLKLKTKLP